MDSTKPLQDILALPGAKYLAILVNDKPNTKDKNVINIFRWLRTGESTSSINYSDPETFINEIIYTVIAYASEPNMKLIGQILIDQIASNINRIIKKCRMIVSLEKLTHNINMADDAYLANFLLTGNNPNPKTIYQIITELIVAPDKVEDMILRILNRYTENVVAGIIRCYLMASGYFPKSVKIFDLLELMSRDKESAQIIFDHFYEKPEAPEVPNIQI